MPDECQVKRMDHLPRPSGNTLPNTDATDLLYQEGAVLTHGQLVQHDSKVLLCKTAFHLVGPKHVLLHRVIPPQEQDFAFPGVELNDIPLCPIPQPIQVPLSLTA